jgi:excisionase family DNA binding protein
VEERLLSIKDVAEWLGVSERTVFRMMDNNEITGIKIGNRWKFESDDIKAFVQRQQQKQGSSSA